MALTWSLYTVSLLLLLQISVVYPCSFGSAIGSLTDTIPRVDLGGKETIFYQSHGDAPQPCGHLVLDGDTLITNFGVCSAVGVLRLDDTNCWNLVYSAKVVKGDLVLVVIQRESNHNPLWYFQQPIQATNFLTKLENFLRTVNSVPGSWAGGFVIEREHATEVANNKVEVPATTLEFERSRHDKRGRDEDVTDDNGQLRSKRVKWPHVVNTVSKDLRISSHFPVGFEKLSMYSANSTDIQLETTVHWLTEYNVQRSLQRSCGCTLDGNMANITIKNGSWSVVFHGDQRTTTIANGDVRNGVVTKRSIEVQKGDLILLEVPTTHQIDYDSISKISMILSDYIYMINYGLANPADCTATKILRDIVEKIHSEAPGISGAMILIE
ncbi:hypothetical protein PSACC_01026 [Paramicrosporidium saccamoebae]|uniref:Uncharacterized protein n=1 Tax=Paramicrosporidium saccamoebae TaxID=1246581 RepID=A0A2H9TND9_9FUNG|nr:hypothetical protein PSACC_01026 [Paramicrosporidium saccamoebae]